MLDHSASISSHPIALHFCQPPENCSRARDYIPLAPTKPRAQNHVNAIGSAVAGLSSSFNWGVQSIGRIALFSLDKFGDGFVALNALRQAYAMLIDQFKPADTDTLLAQQQELDTFQIDECSRVENQVQAQLSQMQDQCKLDQTILSKADKAIQQQVQTLRQHLSQCEQLLLTIGQLKHAAKVTCQTMLTKGTYHALQQASTTQKTLTAQLQQCQTRLNDSAQTRRSLQESLAVNLQQLQQLYDHTHSILQLSQALHLKTGWGNWSAYSQEMADYCLRPTASQAPTTTSNADQTTVAKPLHNCLLQLIQIQQDMKLASRLEHRLQFQLKTLPIYETNHALNKPILKQQLKRSIDLYSKMQNHVIQVRAQAGHAVSYSQRRPVLPMQMKTQQLTQQLQQALYYIRQPIQIHDQALDQAPSQLAQFALTGRFLGQQLNDTQMIDQANALLARQQY